MKGIIKRGTYFISKFTSSFLLELKAKSDIIDIISSYIHLQRKGRDYWACCPFHHEDNPSFQVRQDQQTFFCFGCKKGGNVITFIMEQERLTYPEAIEFLANRANIKIPDDFESPDYRALKQEIEKTQNINRQAAKFYHTYLYEKEGSQALSYLQNRGLSHTTIKTFGIGFSPSSYHLSEYLTKQGYDIATMQKAGLVRIDKNGRPYDIFFGRIIFPIINAQDKVIGFGGRIFNRNDDFAKYVNTATNPAFNKSRSLYSINLLKKLKQTQPVNDVILVEGYMDAISLYQAEIKNVVAPMGTSLTKQQCDIIARYTKLVYICFDGDSAGQNMTLRGLDLLTESGIEVKVVGLPKNKDPDDIIKEYGKEGFLELVSQALPLIDFKLKTAEKGFDLGTLDGKKKYALAATNILSTLNPIEREIYSKIVANKTEIAQSTIIAQASNQQTPQMINKPSEDSQQQINALIIAARFVLASAVELKDYVGIGDIKAGLFEDEFHKAVCLYLERCIENRRMPMLSDIFDLGKNQEEAKLISNSLDTVLPENHSVYYKESLNKLTEHYRTNELKRLINALVKEKDADKKKAISKKIKALNITQPII